MREFQPIPDPSGSLQPPNRRPPTAIGAETPMPEPRPSPRGAAYRAPGRSRLFRTALRLAAGLPTALLNEAVRRVRRRMRR